MLVLRRGPIGEAVGRVEKRREEKQPQRGAFGDGGEGLLGWLISDGRHRHLLPAALSDFCTDPPLS